VNPHRSFEVALAKHPHHAGEMSLNLIPRGGVLRIVGTDFDRASLASEVEVMRGLLLGKAHHGIATMRGIGVAILFLVRLTPDGMVRNFQNNRSSTAKWFFIVSSLSERVPVANRAPFREVLPFLLPEFDRVFGPNER
jgi:hypothetical protein